MTISTVVTRGYGSFGTIAFVTTRGYSIGAVAAASASLLMTEDDDRVSAFVHRNSYVSNPTERGHYVSYDGPKPWLGKGWGDGGPTR